MYQNDKIYKHGETCPEMVLKINCNFTRFIDEIWNTPRS